MWWKNNKWKVIVPLVIAAVLAAAFLSGGKTSKTEPAGEAAAVETIVTEPEQTEMSGEVTQQTSEPAEESPAPETEPVEQSAEEPVLPEAEPPAEETPAAETPVMEIVPETGKDQYQTDPVPEGEPLPAEPQETTLGTNAYSCTLSISCATILDNMERFDPEKVELVPADGWLLQPVDVTFYEGESVFNVLQRACKQQSIHMEFMNTPVYNSAYIEGIGNLYEFDAGDLSGWMYRVNGWFPNYGCSRYQLQDGDIIEWVYTCDLGDDVGGGYSAGVQKEE